MKSLLILLFSLFIVTQLPAQSLKFSPFLGVDYSAKFGSNTKFILGSDFSYEFDSGLEVGFGTYLSKTKVASKGEEILPNNFIDFKPEVNEFPIYFLLKYNYHINDKSVITPYARVGQLRTSIYDDYRLTNDKNDYIKYDDTIFYGNNFYSLGLQYSYNSYYLSIEYKIRMLEQESLNSNYHYNSQTKTYSGYSSYSDRTYKSNSISFTIGYIFDTKNKSKVSLNEQERRHNNKN